MNKEKITFTKNSAGVYGNDIASVSKQLYRYSYDSSTNSTILSRLLSTSSDIYQSGGQINTEFALVDKYDTIVATDSSSKLYITTIQNSSYSYT